nr:hypothetical protein [Escherichia coli]
MAACTEGYFTQVIPGERFRGRNLGTQAVSDYEWYRMRMGTGPQGAIKRELFSDKESLWGYGLIQCRSLIEEMIADGDFSWQACHEMFARKGLMLQKQHHGLVIVDAFNHELTPVKASSIHPDLTLSRAEPQAGPFEIAAADIFERVKPECRYNPELAASDEVEPASGAILRFVVSAVKPVQLRGKICVRVILHGRSTGVNPTYVTENGYGNSCCLPSAQGVYPCAVPGSTIA